MYQWIKTGHLLFVIAWMAAVFYLPRILVNAAEAADQAEVLSRLLLMGRRLYRFGHVMFGLAVMFGLVLWQGDRAIPDFPTVVAPNSGWMHAKLALVALIAIHYVTCGRLLKRITNAQPLPSARSLRWFNEIPVVLLIMIIWLVLDQPF